MTTTAFIMVLFSAIAHAIWNLLLKTGKEKEVFIWLVQVVIVILFLPLALFLAIRHPIEIQGWLFIIGTGIIHAFYFLYLSRAYHYGDVSEVYPIARGIGPALVPILGVLLLGESVSFQAILGIFTVTLGIFMVYWSGTMKDLIMHPITMFKQPSIRYAMAIGIIISVYSIWDKIGVKYTTGFLYMYLMALGTGIFLFPYIFKTKTMNTITTEWSMNWKAISAVGILTFFAYGLVLTALEISKVSYVWPTREVSILVVVILGRLFLKESVTIRRFLGSFLIVVGVMAIALAS